MSNKRILIVYTILFIIFVIILNYLASHVTVLQFGKDGGLLFAIFGTCLSSSIYFYLMTKKPLFIIYGFIIGIIGFILTYALFALLSYILQGDLSGWDLPFLIDQLVATIIIILIGIPTWKINNLISL